MCRTKNGTPYLRFQYTLYIGRDRPVCRNIRCRCPLIQSDYDTRYVYLSVFNDQKWSIVHWARKKGTKARFTKLGRDIVYLPVYFIQGLTIPAGNAFLLDHKGLKTDIQPDISKKNFSHSKNVNSEIRNSNHFLQGVIGGKFQVANRKDFRDSITLYDIPRIEDNRYHKVNTNMSQPYKYFRYLSPNLSRGNMAELYVFNETGDTLRPHEYFGNLHTRPGMGIENLSDGNTLSYYESHDLYNVWYGWEFESPSQISQILFLHGMTIILSERKKYTNYYIGTMENGIL